MKKRAGWRDVRRVLAYVRGVRALFAFSLLLLVLVSALTAAKAFVIQPAVDTFSRREATQTKLFTLCAIVVGIFSLQALLNWSYAVISQMAGTRVVARIRVDLFHHLLRQHLGYFAVRPSSDLTSRVVNDVVAFNYTAIRALQNLLRDTATLVLLLGVMFYMDTRLALVCLGVLAVVGIVLRITVSRLSVASRRVQEVLAKIVHQLSEMIGGIEVILSFGMTKRWRERFKDVNQENYEVELKAQRMRAASNAAIGLIVGLGIACILLLTGGALLRGEISPGRFGSLLAAMYLIQGPMLSIGNGITRMTAGLAAGARALELLDDKPTLAEPAKPATLVHPSGELAFRDVQFAYGEYPALRGVTFDVEPGRLVVMVGDSGAGKSTVARLLLRFYDPDGGRVLFDGVDLRELARDSLYRAATYVSQDVFLFDNTIAANLTVGRPDASDAEIADAVRIACLGEFLADLPDGLDTVVGERGVQLSGGQRQRVAIARAVLTDAPLLVLDEATSALDMDLERRLLKNLVAAARRRTIFAISHRLSLAAVADRVLVLKDGRLVEEGTASALAEQKGEYHRLQQAAGAALHRPARSPNMTNSNLPQRPDRREDVVLRDLGKDAMLYDPRADQVVRLNTTSRRVWELCDGAHDHEAIVATLSREYDVDAEADLAADVRRTLEAFADAGLFAA